MESQRANGTAFGAAMSEERWVRCPNAVQTMKLPVPCGSCGERVQEGWLLVSGANVFRCLACFEKARAK